MRQDQDLGNEEGENSPKFPITVKFAGIFWLVFGSFLMIVGMLNMVANGNNHGNRPGASMGTCMGILAAIAFISTGFQTLKGTIKSVRGAGVASIFLSILFVAGITFAILQASKERPNRAAVPQLQDFAQNEDIPVYGFPAVAIVLGLTLMLSGVLALVGSKDYSCWRDAQDRSRPDRQFDRDKTRPRPPRAFRIPADEGDD